MLGTSTSNPARRFPTAAALPDPRQARARRHGRGDQRGADPARHRRHRHQFLRPQFADVLFGPGRAARRQPATSSSCPTTSATENRASRATACTRAFRTTTTTTWSPRSTSWSTKGLDVNHLRLRDGHVDGLHALLGVGRDVSRFHGRADAAGLPAGADRRAQPHVAQDGDGWDPARSGVEERRLHQRAARGAADRRGSS